jgi:hypothetical protein
MATLIAAAASAKTTTSKNNPIPKLNETELSSVPSMTSTATTPGMDLDELVIRAVMKVPKTSIVVALSDQTMHDLNLTRLT